MLPTFIVNTSSPFSPFFRVSGFTEATVQPHEVVGFLSSSTPSPVFSNVKVPVNCWTIEVLPKSYTVLSNWILAAGCAAAGAFVVGVSVFAGSSATAVTVNSMVEPNSAKTFRFIDDFPFLIFLGTNESRILLEAARADKSNRARQKSCNCQCDGRRFHPRFWTPSMAFLLKVSPTIVAEAMTVIPPQDSTDGDRKSTRLNSSH